MIGPAWEPDAAAPPPEAAQPAMTRRRRRKLLVILLCAAVGLSTPVWVPRILATLPAFHVREVRVTGTVHATVEEIRNLVDIPGSSVWDDPSGWEERARRHPMVREATARRRDFSAIEVAVVERRPVALVATPELRPVGDDGAVLPLRASSAGLDLPIVSGAVSDGMVADPGARSLIEAIGRMARARPDFLAVVSEAAVDEKGGFRFLLLPGSGADEVLLPGDSPLLGLDRVSIALGQVEEWTVRRADARFAGQVVLTRADAR